MTVLVTISFIIIVAILTVLGKNDKLNRRLEEVSNPVSEKKRQVREVFLDENGIKIVKEGDSLYIDIYPYNLHRKLFVPRIAEEDIELLVKTLRKLDSVS